ncbi:MAG: exo-alpha-sialidase [Clostridia bacterium]|nr:exo-alpha-sialidase [Clostridia bacterium]
MAIQKFYVSRDDSIYEAWPDLVLTDGGKLICIFTECKHHGDRALSRLMITESLDRGRTWSLKKQFSNDDIPEDSYYNNARISKLRDGSLAVLCDLVAKDENKSAQIYLWRGDNEGTSWTEPIPTPAVGIVPDKLLEVDNGRWMIAAHFKSEKTGKLTEYLWYSDDCGKSWSERVVLAADPRYNLCEASILKCRDGTLVAFLRENSFCGYDGFKAFSYDNGETWDGVYPIPVPGMHRPTSGWLVDGRAMITHRFLQGGKGWLGSWTQNTFASVMDEGSVRAKERSEQSVRIMPLDYDRSPVSDLGYTGWVQFPDGEIYVVNYIVDDAPKAQIRGYSFYPCDILLSE